MPKSIKNRFIKILACLLVGAVLMSVALLINTHILSGRIEESAVENSEKMFLNGAEGMQRVLSQVKYTMAELSLKLASDRKFGDGSYLEDNAIRADMRATLVDRRQNEFSKYLNTVFLVDTEKSDYIYELTGTFTSDVFFNQYYVSEIYNSDFWIRAAQNGDTFNVFASDVFSTAREAKREDTELLPIAYKAQANSRFIIVALLDMKSVSEDFDFSGIYSKNGKAIYRSQSTPETFIAKADISSEKKGDGYLFSFLDEQNANISMAKFESFSDIYSKTDRESRLPAVLFMISALLSVAFAVAVSARVTSIVGEVEKTIFENPAVKSQVGDKPKGLTDFRKALKTLSAQNAHENAPKGSSSILNSLFLQSRIRDIYVGIDNIEEQVNVSNSFFMLYFRVEYKEVFENNSDGDIGRATFFLKQLIEMNLERTGAAVTILQTEKNSIVAVFDAESNLLRGKELAEEIVSGLSNETEYAYFTVTVSDVYNGIENIKSVYERLVDMAKYTRPITETQILVENEVSIGASRFYFSVEEMGKLSALLQNGTEKDVFSKVDEIFDYNIKKEINSFEMYLLSTEIINCSVKLANRVLRVIPDSLDVSGVYRSLGRVRTPEQHKKICCGFLENVMEHLSQNKREDDYIISYILEYVDNHYSEDIYLNLFAEKLKLTGAYISSYFKEKMNVNLSDYVNNYRIKKALELSENPQNKNKDIAEMVGLPNINTFIRLFKKYTGYTPGEYRKKHFDEDGKKNI